MLVLETALLAVFTATLLFGPTVVIVVALALWELWRERTG
jgi:hypothetical protein